MTEVDGSATMADVSVVATVRDEGGTIEALLDSILGGTVIPAEIVIADGGSTDRTLDIVAAHPTGPTRLVLLTDVGDRSSGRNAAISAAGNRRIVTIDGGCVARPDWLERMVRGFDAGASWVGGFYEPVGPSDRSTAIGLTMVYVREEAEGHFMPSARSMGFTRELWAQAGGFPTGAQFGEDTAFDEALMQHGHRPLFVAEAVVEWVPPATFSEQARTMYRWGYGDGLEGLRGAHYRRMLATLAGLLGIAVLGLILDARLVVLALVPLGVLLARQTRHKYRHMQGSTKWLLIPAATLVGITSSLIGFIFGRRRRLSRDRAGRE